MEFENTRAAAVLSQRTFQDLNHSQLQLRCQSTAFQQRESTVVMWSRRHAGHKKLYKFMKAPHQFLRLRKRIYFSAFL